MHVVSLAPVPVTSLRWRHGTDPWTLSVIVKLSFRLQTGDAVLARRHDPIHDRDSFSEKDEGGSLYVASDLVPVRPRVDVALVGNAFAPRGAPVTSLRVRLEVATIDKALHVEATGAARFKSARLGYEHAPASDDNPIGGSAGGHRVLPAQPALESAFPGFGPLAASWPARRAHLRNSLPSIEAGQHLELPADFDLSFFNAAPRDQQLDELRPSAEIVLENLHPDHPELRTRLPNVVPQVFVEREAEREEASAAISSLWIDTRRSIMTVTWHAHVPLADANERGRIWVAVAGAGRRLSHDQLDHLIGTLRGAEIAHEDTASGGPRSENTQTSLLSKEHLLARTRDAEHTEYHALPESDGMPSWMRNAKPKVGDPNRPPPHRDPMITQQGLGPMRPQWPRSDDLSETSSLPKLQPAPIAAPLTPSPAGRPSPPVVRPPTPSTPPPPRGADTSGIPAPSAPSPRRRRRPREVVEMLWFESERTGLLRVRFRKLCEELEFAPKDDRHDLPPDDPGQARSHHLHFGILTEAPPEDGSGLRRAMTDAISDTGRFTPPLVVLRGTLEVSFDETERLRATAAIIKPIAGDDKALLAHLEQADELLATPLLAGSHDTVTKMTDRLRKAFRESKRRLSIEYLDDTVEQILLEGRHYTRRKLLGGEHLRADLVLRNGSSEGKAIPAYLPADVVDRLPMLPSFAARVVAEGHVRQDQYESHPYALSVVTLGRVVDMKG